MAIASITAWLNSPEKNYFQGRLLYEQYGQNRVTLALIRSGSGNYHFTKLRDALEELNKQANIEPQQITIAKTAADSITIPGSKEQIDFKNAPDKILEIRNDKNAKYAQARHLHESIRWIDSKANRLAAALTLLDLMDDVNESWSIIDEWKEKGSVRHIEEQKQEAEVAEMSEVELIREENRLKPNVSKYRKKLTDATDQRDIMKFSDKLQVLEIRLEKVRGRLNGTV